MKEGQTTRPNDRPRCGRCAAILAAAMSAVTLALPAATTSPAVAAQAADAEPTYQVSGFQLRYLRENPQQPPLDDITALRVTLGKTPAGFVAPREGVEPVTMSIAEMSTGKSKTFSAGAVQTILEAIRDHLVAQDLLGVFVAPDPQDIDQGRDVRPPDRTPLRLIITTGMVDEIRTLGSGDRWADYPDERVNNPLHKRIIDRSPLKPYRDGTAEADRNDLLRKDVLDNYLFLLSRHPGRRVDAALSGAQTAGGVALDYFITENRPLVMYAQVSNTGTEQTNEWRERFGLIHNQLTNNDDIFSLDYITAGFQDSHAVVGSYEAPIGDSQTMRWRVFGSWSEYTASDVGFPGANFFGTTWAAGGEVIANFYQNRELFLDVVGGMRFENIRVENQIISQEGEEDFFIPYVGLRLDRTTSWFSTQGALIFEFHVDNFDSSDTVEINELGRVDPDKDWQVLRFALSHSFYLEPALNWENWSNPSKPESATLAHEVALMVRGQYGFGNRLIPQEEQVVGGLYSVRGYPESIAAGDSAVYGTLEYRWHIPRSFGLQAEPGTLFNQPFRWAPQQVYGRPDWDLILKGFVDIGQTYISDAFSFEDDQTLLGVGVGLEVQLKRNVNLRLDWGFALEDIDGLVDEGDDRLHFVATILF